MVIICGPMGHLYTLKWERWVGRVIFCSGTVIQKFQQVTFAPVHTYGYFISFDSRRGTLKRPVLSKLKLRFISPDMIILRKGMRKLVHCNCMVVQYHMLLSYPCIIVL